MKVIDETWEMTEPAGNRVLNGRDVEAFLTKERLPIAACAPEALRLLLGMEWIDNTSGEFTPMCASCKAHKPGSFVDLDSATGKLHEVLEEAEHTPDCKWLALMKKAGLR